MLDFVKLLDLNNDGNPDNVELVDPATGKTLLAGSPEAKKMWQQVDADAHSAENVAKAKAISGSEKAIGMFMGKPLVPGHPGSAEHPEGDFDFLVNKLVWDGGYDLNTARKIAGGVKFKLYGK